MQIDPGLNALKVERSRHPEGTKKRATAYSEVETTGIGVQMRPAAREPAAGIRDAGALDHHNPQKVGLRCPSTAPDAGTCHRGTHTIAGRNRGRATGRG